MAHAVDLDAVRGVPVAIGADVEVHALRLSLDRLSLLETHDLDRRLPNLSKDHLNGLAEVVGVVRVREQFPQYLQRGCLSEQPVRRLIGFVRVLAFDRRPVQPVPGGQVFLVFVGDLLAGLLRDMGEDRRVERLEDGRGALGVRGGKRDRKSTRLNSSHGYISYAVFCLKKKKPAVKTVSVAQ